MKKSFLPEFLSRAKGIKKKKGRHSSVMKRRPVARGNERATKQSRPNFLILTVDEERFPPVYETPALRAWRETHLVAQRRLRERGFEFKNHYCASTACVPSRVSLWTGFYPSLHGASQTDGAAKTAFDPDMFWLDESTVPTAGNFLRLAKWRTYYKGKWHLNDADILVPGTKDAYLSYNASTGVPDKRASGIYDQANRLDKFGWNSWIGPEPHGQAPHNSGASAAVGVSGRDVVFTEDSIRLLRQLDDEQHQHRTPAENRADRAAQSKNTAKAAQHDESRIANESKEAAAAGREQEQEHDELDDDQQEEEQPWILTVSLVNPHDITLYGEVTRRLTSQFNFAIDSSVPRVPPAPTADESLATKPSCQADYRIKYQQGFQPTLDTEEYRRLYYSLQLSVDRDMQRVLDALDSTRFKDNTIIVWTSDHGTYLGAHGGLFQKWYTSYEEAVHVPMIIVVPPALRRALRQQCAINDRDKEEEKDRSSMRIARSARPTQTETQSQPSTTEQPAVSGSCFSSSSSSASCLSTCAASSTSSTSSSSSSSSLLQLSHSSVAERKSYSNASLANRKTVGGDNEGDARRAREARGGGWTRSRVSVARKNHACVGESGNDGDRGRISNYHPNHPNQLDRRLNCGRHHEPPCRPHQDQEGAVARQRQGVHDRRRRSTNILTSHVDFLPTLLGLAGIDAASLRPQLRRTHTEVLPFVGRDLSRLVLDELSPLEQSRLQREPVLFTTNDNVLLGPNMQTLGGQPYLPVTQPCNIQTVIVKLPRPDECCRRDEPIRHVRQTQTCRAALCSATTTRRREHQHECDEVQPQQNEQDGALQTWKYSRYYDTPQFWTNPGVSNVVTDSRDGGFTCLTSAAAATCGRTDSGLGCHAGTLTSTTTVKLTVECTSTVPVPDQYELYNLSDDPIEAVNLADPTLSTPASRLVQLLLSNILVQQCQEKLLVPSNTGVVPGQLPITQPPNRNVPPRPS